MSEREQERGKAVSERLLEAINAHDLESQLAYFSEDYRSEQPAHPARTFSGREQFGRTGRSSTRASLTSGPSSSALPSLERRRMDLARDQGGGTPLE
jgi:hypothetical protein